MNSPRARRAAPRVAKIPRLDHGYTRSATVTTMALQDLEVLERRLAKRGFKQNDGFLHECTSCKEKAVIKFGIAAKTGGRDIGYCQACGVAKSWRSGAGMEGRVEDPAFDLETFLR